jgi:hypothetical protein
MSSIRLKQNQFLPRRPTRTQKPALAECALSLASTLLLGCQARGEIAKSASRDPANQSLPRRKVLH